MNWEEHTSNDILDIRDGTHDSPKYVETGYPLITSKNLIDGELSFDDVNYISEADYAQINKRSKVDKGDVLYSMIGSIGNYAMVIEEPHFAIKNVALFKFSHNCLDRNFFFHLINSPIINRQIEEKQRGGTQKFVSLKILRNLRIPLPPLPVQQKIATILDTADALKQKNKALIAKYDELSQSLFLNMFGDPVTNPKGWEKKSLGEVTFIDAPMIDPKEDQYLDLLHIGPDRIEKETGKLLPAKTAREDRLISNKFYFNERYVLYSKIRPYLRKVALPNFSGLCSADMYPVRPDEKYLTREYLWNILISPAFTSYTDSLARRANIPKINRKEFARYDCMLPPIALQNQFAERIQAIEQQKQQAQTSLQKSEDLFNCLLQKAFKGELVC